MSISRRNTRNRSQSTSSAQITRDLNHLNTDKNDVKFIPFNELPVLDLNDSNIKIDCRTRSASCIYIRQQPLTLQSSSTTTFESSINNNNNSMIRKDSNVSNTSLI